MVIHGGEGVREPIDTTANNLSTTNAVQYDKSFDSHSDDKADSIKYRSNGAMTGVCPLDTLQDVFTLGGNNKV